MARELSLRRSLIINQLADPLARLHERNQARSALAEILRLTYHEEMPPDLADQFRAVIRDGVRACPKEQV